MLAAYAATVNAADPVAALEVGPQPAPAECENWSIVEVKAASLNHHDLWALRGVGLSEKQLPMILGTDAAGMGPDGEEVVVYGVVGADGHGVGPRERRSILSEKYPGTLAQLVSVPTANLLPKPPELTYAEAACLGTSWLTAYSMLFNACNLQPGQSVLIQGAGGGVSTAAIQLGAAAGLEVIVTSRSSSKRARARSLGAHHAIEAGARAPLRVDAVIESVGAATWGHSVRTVKPGGVIAVCGATSGDQPGAELTRVFFQELTVRGVTMGSRADLAHLLAFCARTDVRPTIDSRFALADAAQGFARLAAGTQFGKIAIRP